MASKIMRTQTLVKWIEYGLICCTAVALLWAVWIYVLPEPLMLSIKELFEDIGSGVTYNDTDTNIAATPAWVWSTSRPSQSELDMCTTNDTVYFQFGGSWTCLKPGIWNDTKHAFSESSMRDVCIIKTPKKRKIILYGAPNRVNPIIEVTSGKFFSDTITQPASVKVIAVE